jgi:hypothetical protein
MTPDGRSFYGARDLAEVANLIRNSSTIALEINQRASGRSMISWRTYVALHGKLWSGAAWDLGWAAGSDREPHS